MTDDDSSSDDAPPGVADPDEYASAVGLDDQGRPHSDQVLRRANRRERRP